MRTLQLFNWKLNSITNILETVYQQGYDTILISPIQGIKNQNDFHWWLSYQPTSFTIGNVFGTKEDLIKLCHKASQDYNIAIHVEVACNTVATMDNFDYNLNKNADLNLLLNPDLYKKRPITDYENRYDATFNACNNPTLDFHNKKVIAMVTKYLVELAECGVKGFNLVGAKHIGLPNDGVHFFDNIKEFTNDNSIYLCGEFLGGNKDWRDEFIDYLDIYTHEYTDVYNERKRNIYYENADKYMNNKYYGDYLSGNKLEEKYVELVKRYPKVVFFTRPKDRNEENLHIESINEENYYDDLLLTSEKIKEANHLVKRRSR